jgi:hypothetical protein
MFDGDNLWVSMYFDDQLIRMDLDGTILATFPVPRAPYEMAYDGVAVWVANLEDDAVTKVVK